MPSAIKARLIIFASGGGSNADVIATYFRNHSFISVEAILTNNSKAGVIDIAKRHHLPCHIVPKNKWSEKEAILPLLKDHQITHIILAGFLLLIPDWLIAGYPDHIVNIHPALLPNYGGKGMYGHHVHEAVKKSGDHYTGLTIHKVDEHYDKGDVLFQYKIAVDKRDTPEQIATKVLKLEHYYYPRVIEKWILDQPLTGVW